MRWPGKVPAGKVSDAVWATVDFLPTFAALTGFEIPKDRPIDGMDQTSLLLGQTDKGRESFYYDKAGIRMGKWKYLTANAFSHNYASDPNRKQEEELYDLDKDIGETTNLAKQCPEIVATMKQAFLKIDSRTTGQNSEDPEADQGKESKKKRKASR